LYPFNHTYIRKKVVHLDSNITDVNCIISLIIFCYFFLDFAESDDEPLSKIVVVKVEMNEEKQGEEVEDGLSCKNCKKKFKEKKALTAHFRFCNNKEKYQCDLCGSEYKTKGFLKKHKLREHDDDNKVGYH